jgi:branched-chain amino acid transport system permease protein
MLLAAAATAVVLLPMPSVLALYPLILLCEVLVFAIACMGMNLVFGTAGLLSFGHATFFAISAYAGAFLCRFTPVDSFEIYLIFGVSFSVLLAVALGFLCIRATRIHFTILTLAFCQIVYSLFINGAAFELFGGEGRAIYYVTEGSMYIPRLTLFETPVGPHAFIPVFYNVIVVGFVAAAAVLWRIDHSPFGLALRAIRDNEVRAAAVGIRVQRFRWYAFILSGAFVALAGSLYGQLNRQITPEQLDWLFSAKLILAVVIGGSRQYLGPILGAALFVGLEEVALGWIGFHHAMLGMLLIAAVFLFPTGLAGAVAAVFARLHPYASGRR